MWHGSIIIIYYITNCKKNLRQTTKDHLMTEHILLWYINVVLSSTQENILYNNISFNLLGVVGCNSR